MPIRRKANARESKAFDTFIKALMDSEENSEIDNIEIHEVRCAYEERLDIIEERITVIERVLSKMLR